MPSGSATQELRGFDERLNRLVKAKLPRPLAMEIAATPETKVGLAIKAWGDMGGRYSKTKRIKLTRQIFT